MKKTLLFVAFALLTQSVFAVDDINKALEQRKQQFLEAAPEAVIQDFELGIEYVAASGVVEKAINQGDKAPNFTLPDAAGTQIELYQLLKKGPVIVTWYRGGWCPYCNIYLHGLQERLPEIKQHGAQLIAISPELPDNTLSTQEKNALTFHVLSDVNQKAAEDYNIVYTLPDYVIKHFNLREKIAKFNGNQSNTLPLSVSYVIAKNGIVKYAFVNPDYRKRAPIDELINAIK